MQILFILSGAMVFGACSTTQYYHPIKKTAEFYDDLAGCESQADREGARGLQGASRDRAINQCLGHMGWHEKKSCYFRRTQSRMPASEACR